MQEVGPPRNAQQRFSESPFRTLLEAGLLRITPDCGSRRSMVSRETCGLSQLRVEGYRKSCPGPPVRGFQSTASGMPAARHGVSLGLPGTRQHANPKPKRQVPGLRRAAQPSGSSETCTSGDERPRSGSVPDLRSRSSRGDRREGRCAPCAAPGPTSASWKPAGAAGRLCRRRGARSLRS